MTRIVVTSVALAASAALAAGAAALEGGYSPPGVDVVFTFTADGEITGVTPDGVAASDHFEIDGDTITITGGEDHPICAGKVGVYTFVETDTDVTFTLVSDECEARAEGMPAGPWVKVDDE